MQNIIKFIGKVSQEGQTNGLPPEVYGFLTLQDADSAAITNAVASQFGLYRNMGGMLVEKEQGSLINIQINWLSRMYVPFNWIVSVSLELYNLSQDITAPDKDGIERQADGTTAVKQ